MKHLRQEYKKNQLLETFVDADPLVQFNKWFEQAMEEGVPEPNAMVLSTVSAEGVDSRTVLLKGIEDRQFVFYTNYNSNKGQQLQDNPSCSLLFLWLQQERQIIIRGHALKHSPEASEAYFQSRPRESRIGAWVSDQSTPISSREDLEAKLTEYMDRFKDVEVPRPEHWGGFCVVPYEIEFWQGRPSRLHDRILYFIHEGEWRFERLQP